MLRILRQQIEANSNEICKKWVLDEEEESYIDISEGLEGFFL